MRVSKSNRSWRPAGALVVLIGLLGASAPAWAEECAHDGTKAADESPAARAFDRLKALEGTWTMAGERGPMTVTYKTTAAGSVVHETLFPGTPHEMVTVYHRDGADLVLTHYCAAGNEPHLKLEAGSDPDHLSFRFESAANLAKPTDGHMHDLVLRFVDADKLAADWTYWKDGKAAETKTFLWTRATPHLSAVASAKEEPAAQPSAPLDPAAAQAAWMKLAAPGAAHEVLKPLVGKWSAVTTSWEAPGAPAQSSKSSSVAAWVLGDRFVYEAVKGTFGGMTFEGIGYTGYDNQKQKYVSVWMDVFGTMIMTLTGDYDATTKTLTMIGQFDGQDGKPQTMKSVTRFLDARQHVAEMYTLDPTGGEFKMMEIAYKRR